MNHQRAYRHPEHALVRAGLRTAPARGVQQLHQWPVYRRYSNGLGCGCDQQDGQLGLFGIGSALKDLGRSIARPFESAGREIRRVYDRVEDVVKPFLPAIASVIPVVGQALGPLVGQYRAVRDLQKLEKAELDYARNELPKQLMQRACSGGLPLDCVAYGGGAPQQLTGELMTIAQQLRAVHSEASYRQAITAAGDSPGPVIESILVQQDQHAQAWAQQRLLPQQPQSPPLQQPTASALPGGMPAWAPWAGVAALAVVWMVNR
jgi:hypothetical protein